MILVAEPHPGGTETPWLVIEARWIEVPQEDGVGTAFPGFYAAYAAIYGNCWCCKPIVGIRATYWMPLPDPPNVKTLL